LFYSYAGPWGHPTLFGGTRVPGQTLREAIERLRTYMVAKKHQMRSDRSLGLLLDQRRNIIATIYMNGAPAEDPGLDKLGQAIGLRSIEESRRPVPPSALRTTRRLRARRKRKK
jgi:hypothetical protein